MRTRPGIPRPGGNDGEAEFQIRQDRRANQELRPKNSSTVKWQQTTHGFFPKVAPSFLRGGLGVQGPFLLKSVKGDYLVCKRWTGIPDAENIALANSGPDVYIAKCARHRHSITKQTIESVTYYYTYPGDALAGAADNVNTFGAVGADGFCLSRIRKAYTDAAHTVFKENVIITPEWIPGELTTDGAANFVAEMIWAVSANTGVWRTPPSSDPVTLLMLDDGRAWSLHA